ncbi:hypothetical protein AB6A40_006053 [Gnathostoma spinigerum]|uniref:sphinganine-1-phosphate aldolase n=1 Tax=Gnathostoma spinigerum TaxID=75299 RepID=A0ABD6EMG6_9BILA
MNEVWPSVEDSAWRLLVHIIDDTRLSVNRLCLHLEPWQIVSYTFSLAFFLLWLREQLKADKPFINRLRGWVFRRIRKFSWIRVQIQEKMNKIRDDLEEYVHKYDEKKEFYKFLPERGLFPDDIIHEAKLYSHMSDIDVYSGHVSGVVYSEVDEQHLKVMEEIFSDYCYSNLLRPDLFPGCRKMEAEVVRMVCSLYNGGPTACGAFTSGGTESVLLACLAYRNRAYEKGIRHPEIVVPVTAHAAFDKAADLFNLRIVHVPVTENQKADVGAIKRAINRETCLLVASAPSFPSGTVDNIEAICELGRRYNLPVHVDACHGGFLLPFMERCGYRIPPYDFRVAGVSSISCDTQKHGCAPTGSSLILYRETSLLHYQYCCKSEWPGGIYSTPTLLGSRNGAFAALTWATMLYYGWDGFAERTRRIIEAARRIHDAFKESQYVEVLGEPELSTIAFVSKKFNVYALHDRLLTLGWNLHPLQHPAAIHVCVTINHTKDGVIDSFIQDFNIACEDVMKNPFLTEESRTAAIYGMAANVPDKSLIDEVSQIYLDTCYATPQPPQPVRTLSIEGRKISMIGGSHSSRSLLREMTDKKEQLEERDEPTQDSDG